MVLIQVHNKPIKSDAKNAPLIGTLGVQFITISEFGRYYVDKNNIVI